LPENSEVQRRIARSESLISQSYYKASVIDKIIRVRDAGASDADFLKLYRRTYIPKEWFVRKDIYTDLIFGQFGSNLAFSEIKFILEEILKNKEIERLHVPEIGFNALLETSVSLIGREVDPTVLFMPIDYYTDLYTDWRVNPGLRINPFDNITILGQRYKIFWSNKYMPFNEVLFIDKNFGEWVAKPNFRERLSAKISESDKVDQLDLLIFTTLKLRLLQTNRIKILQISSEE